MDTTEQTKTDIPAMLDMLATLYDHREAAALERDYLIEQFLDPSVRTAVANLRTEWELKQRDLNEQITDLEVRVKEAVRASGQSIAGRFLQAVFNRGRVSWDTKALEGFAAAYPEIRALRKEGDPTVSIRVLK